MKSESSIQQVLWKLIQAYRLPGVLIFHIPNGEKRDARTAARLKAMGVTPGVPDFGYIADGQAGFLELKNKAGILSDAQLGFIALAANHSIRVEVAHSVIEAAQILQSRGVLDPRIKFTVTDDPQGLAGARPDGSKRAVRSNIHQGTTAPA